MAPGLWHGLDAVSDRAVPVQPNSSGQIYWRDRNIKFHLFPLVPPSPRIDDLLVAIDADPTGTFWG